MIRIIIALALLGIAAALVIYTYLAKINDWIKRLGE